MEFYQISITHSKPIIVCYIIMHGKRRTEEQEGREWSGRDAGSQCFTQFSILSQSCSPLEKGRTKGAGWIDGICTNPLLHRSCLCAATHPPLTRSPLPCEQGRVNFCGEAAGPQLSNLNVTLLRPMEPSVSSYA